MWGGAGSFFILPCGLIHNVLLKSFLWYNLDKQKNIKAISGSLSKKDKFCFAK